MKKVLFILLSVMMLAVACTDTPKKPTQEWCEWAFSQIPDHKDFNEVESRAFSTEFRGLLEKAYMEREIEEREYPGELGDYEFLFYWYDGNGDSLLDFEDSSISYRIDEVKDGRTTVHVIINTPSLAPYSPTEHKFAMHLLYEDRAWRIDDWRNPDWGESMKAMVKSYLAR